MDTTNNACNSNEVIALWMVMTNSSHSQPMAATSDYCLSDGNGTMSLILLQKHWKVKNYTSYNQWNGKDYFLIQHGNFCHLNGTFSWLVFKVIRDICGFKYHLNFHFVFFCTCFMSFLNFYFAFFWFDKEFIYHSVSSSISLDGIDPGGRSGCLQIFWFSLLFGNMVRWHMAMWLTGLLWCLPCHAGCSRWPCKSWFPRQKR